jgi:hypothetical protein
MKRAALAIALCGALARLALAGPADYVHRPTVDYGEREIELKVGRAKLADGTHAHAAKLGFGMGLKPWWFSELYVGFQGGSGESTKYEAVEWENIFQLTETGRHPFEAGVLIEIERPRDHAEGFELKYGPLLQAEIGRVQLNGNAILERHVRAATPGDTELHYEWQAKYRLRREFEFGLQGFGELGKWDHWNPHDQQSHTLGPAVFGKIPLGGQQSLRYDAAYLLAASPAAPDHTLRFRIEYEF